jgi:3-hydroxy-9,10-secoandrosta-1,3,5(10)-triene-9,17-dione monooxygenase reductase component
MRRRRPETPAGAVRARVGRWSRPDERGFRDLMGLAPAPVVVVTGRDAAGAPLGLTVGSFTSVSLRPALALISVGIGSPTWARIARTGRYAVCLLGNDQQHLARRFAGPGDRFDGVPCETSPTGLPILSAAHAAAEFAVAAVHRAGDHDIVVGELLRARSLADRPPLIHHRGGDTTLAAIDRRRLSSAPPRAAGACSC